MREENYKKGQIDWVTLGLYIMLVTIGWLTVYASVYDEVSTQSIWNFSSSAGRQFVFIIACIIIIIVISIVDFHFYNAFAYIIYALALCLLVVTLVIGKEVGGNKAWIGLGSFGIQPSEFAKWATALAIAKFIGSIGFKMKNWHSQLILFLIIGAPIGLILLQKDVGTAFVFLGFMLVFYREGMSPFFLIVGIAMVSVFIITLLVPTQLYIHGAVVVITGVLIFLNRKKKLRIIFFVVGALVVMGVSESVDYVITDVLKPHQQNRIRVLINPSADPLGHGWNVTQSKIAIGSGGMWGKGFLKGTQTKFNFVPEQSTDFIFCAIGEEQGWMGSIIVVGLFVLLLFRIIYLVERQKNRFARSYGYCVVSIFFVHFTVNIGMTIGLFPVIGIPLPFFSYGGSALWSFTILLFTILKLDAHRGQILQRI